jgi:hypothetical protein
MEADNNTNITKEDEMATIKISFPLFLFSHPWPFNYEDKQEQLSRYNETSVKKKFGQIRPEVSYR